MKLLVATEENYDQILDITKSENLYNGMDYLPFALKNWLQEAAIDDSNRLNVIFTRDGEVVGFESVYFMNDKKVAVRFAFRISKYVRGKGFGKQAIKLLGTYLKDSYPGLASILSSIPDFSLSDEEAQSTKHGKLLVATSVCTYSVQYNDLKSVNILDSATNLSLVSKEEFRKLLKSQGLQHLLANNLLHINWIPILLETDDDIEFAVRKKQTVLVKNCDDDYIDSFSILTLPYQVQNGNARISIDVFAEDKESVKVHIQQQLLNFAQGMKESSFWNECKLSIFVNQNLNIPGYYRTLS